MSIKHLSRSGKIYYLHMKPRKSGKPNFYFSMDAEGTPVAAVPAGFEIYENVRGQVFLRLIPEKLITDEELRLTRAALTAHAEEWHYKIEVKKNILTIFEAEKHAGLSEALVPWVNPAKDQEFRIRHAHYMAVFRFILIDPAKRLFAPERFCFRGSVDDWIGVGAPARLPTLLKNYVKHLGSDSIYELY